MDPFPRPFCSDRIDSGVLCPPPFFKTRPPLSFGPQALRREECGIKEDTGLSLAQEEAGGGGLPWASDYGCSMSELGLLCGRFWDGEALFYYLRHYLLQPISAFTPFS